MSPRFLIATDKPGNWRPVNRLLPYVWQYRRRVMVGLVFLVLARLANISVPLILKGIVDQLEQTPVSMLAVVPISLLVGYGGLRFGTILFNEIRNVVVSHASVQIVHRISAELFQHLHRLSLGFHLDRKIGGLARNMERGLMAVTQFLRIFVFSIIPVVLEITLVLSILGARFDHSFIVTTLAMIIVYIGFTLLVTRWRIHFRVQMNAAESSANTRAMDSLINYETVKAFGNETLELRRYHTMMRDWVHACLKNNLSLAFLNCGQGAIIAVGLTMLMIFAAAGVVDGSLTLGDFVMVNAFLIQLYIPLNFLGSVYRDLNHAMIDMEQMFDLLDRVPEVADRPGAGVIVPDTGRIEFERVHFAYTPDKPILQDISFTIPGGQMVAVVGPSGSGKSTLARLLLRFYDPDSGRICIDGQDIQTVTVDSLRRMMGIVPQDTVLFNESIGYNIAYGKAGAGQAEIEAAAKAAQLHDFIRQHPQGYDILVGERGLKLSGGEKQRVAIARVVLKGARILIFDEATSSLDSRSEQAIQQSIELASRHNTTLIIAHRLSTVVNADNILVLDNGAIVQQGRHRELLAAGGLYEQMWRLQQQQRAD